MSDQPKCSCLVVHYLPIRHDDGSMSARWQCGECKTEFVRRGVPAQESSRVAPGERPAEIAHGRREFESPAGTPRIPNPDDYAVYEAILNSRKSFVAYICPSCTALVTNREAHSQWHREVAERPRTRVVRCHLHGGTIRDKSDPDTCYCRIEVLRD